MEYEGGVTPGDLSFSALFLPPADRAWFDGRPAPFRGLPDRFVRADAAWLAEAALLAYLADEGAVAAALAGAGFPDVRCFSAGSTHAFVAAGPAGAVVAFRGTEPGDLEDLKTDLSFRLAPAAGVAGRVHRGFAAALDSVWDGIAARIAAASGPVRFTGHSLGGALATLAAARHAGPATLVTFGSPRVGDAAFRDGFPHPAFRVVNGNDFVCRIPLFPYRHVGERWFLGPDGRLHRDPGGRVRFREELDGHLAHLKEVARRLRRRELDAIPFAALVDHSPLLYADRMKHR